MIILIPAILSYLILIAKTIYENWQEKPALILLYYCYEIYYVYNVNPNKEYIYKKWKSSSPGDYGTYPLEEGNFLQKKIDEYKELKYKDKSKSKNKRIIEIKNFFKEIY